MNLRDWHYKKLGAFLSQQEPIEPLPQGYKRVEYLESTGTQYIDTLFYRLYGYSHKVEITFRAKNINAVNSIFGARESTSSRNYALNLSATNLIRIGWNYNVVGDRTNDEQKHTIIFDNGKVSLDGQMIYESSNNDFFTLRNTFLFAINAQNGVYYSTNVQIFDYRLDDYDILVQHLLPCLDNNNRPCMYDTVSKQTFYNQGTGEFLYGNIV